ncbi:hypothetical protein D3C86_1373920 [compost metagenome]
MAAVEPRLMLMTLAPFWTACTMALATAAEEPPLRPRALMGMILQPGAAPATPCALAMAAMVPATWVPCPSSSMGSVS